MSGKLGKWSKTGARKCSHWWTVVSGKLGKWSKTGAWWLDVITRFLGWVCHMRGGLVHHNEVLPLLTAEEDTTVQELVAEALDMLFESRNKPMIAR